MMPCNLLGAMRFPLATLAIAGFATWALSQVDFGAARRRMVEEIERMVAATATETGIARPNPRVLMAIADAPRHAFVPDEHKSAAYRNRPLPIVHGQTISQPYIVAIMTELLRLQGTEKVLEVGT